MEHPNTVPARDPKLDFPAARHQPIDPAQQEHMDMNLPLIGTVAAAGGMLVFVIIVCTHAWFLHVQAKAKEAATYNQVNHELVDRRQQQRDSLNQYRWVDNNQTIVAIPLDRAMELTIEKYRKAKAESGQDAAPTPTPASTHQGHH